MIKKSLSLLMYFILILSLTSCKTDINANNKKEVASTYIIDTSDLESINYKYVFNIFHSGIGINSSWDTPNEIDPTSLFIFYVFKDSSKLKSTEKIIDIYNNEFYYEIDTVYEGLKKYFLDFDKENLRKSDCYDSETDMLHHGGLGAIVGIHYTIISAKQTDDILEINYNIDDSGYEEDLDPPLHLSSTLKVKIIDKDNFKYLSYHVEDNKDYI